MPCIVHHRLIDWDKSLFHLNLTFNGNFICPVSSLFTLNFNSLSVPAGPWVAFCPAADPRLFDSDDYLVILWELYICSLKKAIIYHIKHVLVLSATHPTHLKLFQYWSWNHLVGAKMIKTCIKRFTLTVISFQWHVIVNIIIPGNLHSSR